MDTPFRADGPANGPNVRSGHGGLAADPGPHRRWRHRPARGERVEERDLPRFLPALRGGSGTPSAALRAAMRRPSSIMSIGSRSEPLFLMGIGRPLYIDCSGYHSKSSLIDLLNAARSLP